MYNELAKRLNKDFEIHILKVDGKNRFTKKEWTIIVIKRALFSFLRFIRQIKKIQPDIIHGYGSLNMALLLIFFKKIFSKKIILTFTDFKKNIIKDYSILNKLDAVIVQTEYAKDRLIKNNVKEEIIHKIIYGVEDSFNSAKICDDIRSLSKKIILYYGDARYERGFDLLLNSAGYLNKDILLLMCIRDFYGNRRNLNEIKNIKILTMDKYPCPIQDIIKSSDIVVLPFIKNTLEPPLTIMETAVVGKPIITTDIGGNKEVINKNSIVMDHINPKILADKINRMILNIPKDKKRKFLWENTIKKIKKIYCN